MKPNMHATLLCLIAIVSLTGNIIIGGPWNWGYFFIGIFSGVLYWQMIEWIDNRRKSDGRD